MNKNYTKQQKSVEKSLFDEVNFEHLSEFIAKFGIDGLKQKLREFIASENTGGDSDD